MKQRPAVGLPPEADPGPHRSRTRPRPASVPGSVLGLGGGDVAGYVGESRQVPLGNHFFASIGPPSSWLRSKMAEAPQAPVLNYVERYVDFSS